MIEFDSAKSTKNQRERGIGFERFADMDLETAISLEDTRKGYGERRLRGWAPSTASFMRRLLHREAKPSA